MLFLLGVLLGMLEEGVDELSQWKSLDLLDDAEHLADGFVEGLLKAVEARADGEFRNGWLELGGEEGRNTVGAVSNVSVM